MSNCVCVCTPIRTRVCGVCIPMPSPAVVPGPPPVFKSDPEGVYGVLGVSLPAFLALLHQNYPAHTAGVGAADALSAAEAVGGVP